MNVKDKTPLSTQVNASPPRDIALDGLRGFGALIVVLWHTSVVFFPTAAFGIAVPEASRWQMVFYNSPAWVLLSGSFAVNLFFVISGYVLTIRYFRTPELPSMIRRILGRWPRLAIPAAVSTICAFTFFLLVPGYRDAELLPALKATGSFALYPTGLGTLKLDLQGLLDNLFWRPWFLPPDLGKLYNGVLWERLINASAAPRWRLDRLVGRQTAFWVRISLFQARRSVWRPVSGQTCPHAIRLRRTRNRLPSANRVKRCARFLARPR